MEKIEELIAAVYKEWKSGQGQDIRAHPDEEAFTAFLSGGLSAQENNDFRAHAVKCPRCADILASCMRLGLVRENALNPQFLEKMREFIQDNINADRLEIILAFKDSALRLLETNGDLQVGQELIPSAVLRGRRIKDLKDDLNLLKEFRDFVAEVKIINKCSGVFEMAVRVREKQTQKPVKDLRISLLKNGLELESFHTDSGKAVFEHITVGRYKVEISGISGKKAEIDMEIQT